MSKAVDPEVQGTELMSRSSNKTAGVHPDPKFVFNYDLTLAPKGQKLTVLTLGRTATEAYIISADRAKAEGIIAWQRLPSRDYELEEKLGLNAPDR